MFKNIRSIQKLGIFCDFDWNLSIRDKGNNVAEFKELNIFYGRNYSGKTTLSRIFRALEKGVMPPKYVGAQFELEHTSPQSLKHSNLTECPYEIRVYNKDFIGENLKWLTDDEGSIRPFAVIGEANIEIEKNIDDKERLLGNVDEKTGVRYDYKCAIDALNKQSRQMLQLEESLNEKLRRKANDSIKSNPIYQDVTYNINDIKSDINRISKERIEILTDDQRENNNKLLKEKYKEPITQFPIFSGKLGTLVHSYSVLMVKEIKPSESIQELLNDALVQEWVRDGISHHRDKRESCAFCGAMLSDELWGKLDAHFSKESENLRADIIALVEKARAEKLMVENSTSLKNDQVYSIYHTELDALNKTLKKQTEAYISSLDKLILDLEAREKDIFNTRKISEIIDNSSEIGGIYDELNDLIERANKKTDTLAKDQASARYELRLDEVARFTNDIDLAGEKAKIEKIREGEVPLKNTSDALKEKIDILESDISELKLKLKDERQGAEKVNEYLSHYFGHDGLRLVAEEEDSGMAFKVLRGKELAHSLSEGECSLISFCYFMARLEDVDTKGKEVIIWIDDPISSLDSNHIYFVFSLIENVIAKPYKNEDGTNGYSYKQLFISTHNLDFLKYLKRLSRANRKNESEYFIVERVGVEESTFKLMPNYLKKYITEFNYLFNQIYKCRKAENADVDHECFYNFGNNLRKFLEAYLFYKYPENAEVKEKLKKFFDDDQVAVDVTNRLDNELSHLELIFDRSMRPIEIPEIPKLAQYVLEHIERKDEAQYAALLRSIGAVGE